MPDPSEVTPLTPELAKELAAAERELIARGEIRSDERRRADDAATRQRHRAYWDDPRGASEQARELLESSRAVR